MTNFIDQIFFAANPLDQVEKLQKTFTARKLEPQDFIYSLLAIVVSIIAAKIISSIVDKTVLKYVKNVAIRSMIERLIRYGILILGLTVALSFIGLNFGWVSAMFALIVLMLYLTVRPLIQNMGAGFLLQARPSFTIGSWITVGDFYGKVVDINSRSTVLHTIDHRAIHIPNSIVLDKPLIVHDSLPRRRSQIELKLSSLKELEVVEGLAQKEIPKLKGVLNVPEPSLRLKSVQKDELRVVLRWWHNNKPSSSAKTTSLINKTIATKLKF